MLKQLQMQFAEVLEQKHAASYLAANQPHFSAAQAMQIYQNNYLLSLIEALSASYPSVLKLVGEDYFNYIGKKFVLQYGHSQGDLNLFGAGFAHYLAQQNDLSHLAYLPAMAELDWTIERCAGQPLAKQCLSLGSLQAIASQDLSQTILPLASNLLLLSSSYPVLTIYQMLEQEQVQPIELDQAQYLVLSKQADFSVLLEPLSELEYAFLAHCQQHRPLTELAPNCIAQLQNLLGKAISLQYLTQPIADSRL